MKYHVIFNDIDDEFKVIHPMGHAVGTGKTQEEAINGAVDCFGISEDDIQRL